ncbi:hypothetical protein PIROE2DRAFT_3328 [Piromyces sp. E2]|nr:hypothetical protein PIROE2DRAFT_3328 [Piromyces sp. E2]|eukprot:OUM68809.1 hypothetical protein PIROE2DRAFT_3328 [Piromyces sp. E2]
MSATSMNTNNNINNLNLNMDSIPANTNKTRKIASPQKLSHRRSRSFDINSLNKTFSKLNVQSNIKSEKRGIDKINEVILGKDKYFIPEKPVLNINTKILSNSSSRRSSFRTPNSEVDYNELLKSLDDLTSEVKSNTIKRCKRNENKKECNETKNKVESTSTNVDNTVEIKNKNDENVGEKPIEPTKPTLKHSGSLRYLLSLTKKSSKESIKDGEENSMPNFTGLLQNSKNYLLNLTKKNPENDESETSQKPEETKPFEEKKAPEEIKVTKEVDNKESIQIPDINITINSRKSSEATIYKSDNDQCESTKRSENIEEEEEEVEDNSIINQGNENSVINLYSKNRDSINLDVYMNSEMFPNTPVTPISPEDKPGTSTNNKLEVISENKEEEIDLEQELRERELREKELKEKELKEKELREKELREKELRENKMKEKERKKFESLALPKLPPVYYGHKKSNSEVVKLPLNKLKEKNNMRHSYSKDNLEVLKKQDVEASFEIISNNEYKKDSEVERNPVRHDSIRYSNSHTINNKDAHTSKRKSFLNQKNNNSHNLRKKQSGNRLSVNRSSINFQDMQNVKDVTKSFYVNNKNFKTKKTTDDTGNDVYYIKRLNNNEEETNNAAAIKLYRNTRKLSDVSKRQRSDSNSSNRSLPIMNKSDRPYKYDKITVSPKLLVKTTVPVNKSTLSNQSFNADEADFDRSKVLLSAFPQEEEDSLNLMTSNIERDKSIEKMMDSLEAMKNSINGEKGTNKEGIFRPSWAKTNSRHNSSSSNIASQRESTKKTPKLEESKMRTPNLGENKIRTPRLDERKSKTPNLGEKKSPEDSYYVASPQRKQYQSGGLVFSKRNSSLTRFSVVSARTRHSVAQASDVAVKSKFYRYSVNRNMNTYNNPNSLPIPSHHTKLTIPHFNPNIIPIQTPQHTPQHTPQQTPQLTPHLAPHLSNNRKDSIDSVGSQETLTMEGSYNTNIVDSSVCDNNTKSFLFRDTRESKYQNHNVSNIINEIPEEEEEDRMIEDPPLEFNFTNKNKNEYNKNEYNNNSSNTNNINFNKNKSNHISYNQNSNTFTNSNEKKSEIVSKINVTEIPFLYNKEQADWESNMHSMSLYDDQNPKPKKNKKGFRKTFSIFKKNKK